MTQRIRLPFPLANLISDCLTCDVGCCGIDAYNPKAEMFQKWGEQEQGNDLQVCLEQLEPIIEMDVGEDVEVNFGNVLISFDKNNNQIITEPFSAFTNKEWLEFLQDCRQEINKAKAL